MNKNIMAKMGFAKELNLIKEGKCPSCKEKINKDDFVDELSKKEFTISGLCMACQDKMFKKE